MAKQQPKNNMPQLPRFNIFWIYGIIAAFIIGWSLLSQENSDPVKGDWPMVEQMVEQGEVERIRVVNRETAEVFLKKEAVEKYHDGEDVTLKRMPATGAQLYFTIGSVDAFREDLKAVEEATAERVPVVYENEKNDWM